MIDWETEVYLKLRRDPDYRPSAHVRIMLNCQAELGCNLNRDEVARLARDGAFEEAARSELGL